MEIRRPEISGYKIGNLSPNVKRNRELKNNEAIKRGLDKKEYDNILEKMRSEMWFPNIDITTSNIKIKIEKVDEIKVVKFLKEEENKKNLIIFLHGGGYYGGSIDTIKNTCKYMAEQLDATILAVDYSLAPEFPFPTALNECYRVLKHYENMYQNIYLAGDSAGGGLACSVVIKDIEERTKISKGLIMYYPVLLIDLKDNIREDFVWNIKEYDIDIESEDAALMSSEAVGLKYAMPFIKKMYVKSEEKKENYYISQISTPDEILKEFPKTLIFTVEYDYLRLEAEYFHKRLKENNVKTKGIRYAGLVHAFIDMIGYEEQVLDSVKEIGDFLND